jgi:shikimate kinase
MGAGKTTLGRALADILGLQFVDLDHYIEMRYHKTITQIFADNGESGFREIERRMLHEAGEFENVVISTGGGTPCFFDNMEYMNEVGETVFLDVDIQVLFRRLKVAKQQRPLLDGKSDEELLAFIREALDKRLPHYSKAKYTFNGERLEDRRQIQQSVERLKELLNL